MSKKATGPVIVEPDEPVKAHSPELENAYAVLLRLQTTLITIPDDIKSIKLLIDLEKKEYYKMREWLEADFGISEIVASRLPVPSISNAILTLAAWEKDFETSKQEYDRRVFDDEHKVRYNGEYIAFWGTVRMSIYEFTRCLTITSRRISNDAAGFRYPS